MSAKGRVTNTHGGASSKLTISHSSIAVEDIAAIQRARLLSAMTEVVCERGAGNATVARVVERAGVSRRTFYELFDDREHCFMAAFEEGMARASRYVLETYDPDARWAVRLRSALIGLLGFLTYERGVGQLLIDGSLGAGPIALERRKRVLAQIITIVDEGRKELKRGVDLPPLTAEGVVGGAFSVIHARLMDDNEVALYGLVGPLMAMIVLPYQGPAAARRQLALPTPQAANGTPRVVGSDPLRELDMRLTYRTVRVLLAIGERPGCSNRQIADSSGIRDQGQVSKLLARLQHLGLIHNAGDPLAKGEPNAWTLTRQGDDVRARISIASGAAWGGEM